MKKLSVHIHGMQNMASEFSLARDNYVAQHVHTSRFLRGWLAVRQPDLHWQRIQVIELLLGRRSSRAARGDPAIQEHLRNLIKDWFHKMRMRPTKGSGSQAIP